MINVGVIGVGYLGKYHVKIYKELNNIKLVGIYDKDKNKAEKIAKEFNVISFPSLDELLSEVSAVSIVIPATYHFEIAKKCIEKGLDVFIEKPITANLYEAEELIRLAERKNVILQVGHSERFNAGVIALMKEVKNPRFIEVHRLCSFKGRGIDVDVILDLMIHDIDILINIVDSEIENIDAIGVPVITNKIDIANVRIRFKNGCIANLTASRVSLNPMRKIRIFQKYSYLSLDYALQKLTKVNIVRNQIIKEEINVVANEPLKNELEHFRDCLIKRKKPKISGEDGKKALAIAIKILDEIEKNLIE